MRPLSLQRTLHAALGLILALAAVSSPPDVAADPAPPPDAKTPTAAPTEAPADAANEAPTEATLSALYRAYIDALNRRDLAPLTPLLSPAFCLQDDKRAPADLAALLAKHPAGDSAPITVQHTELVQADDRSARLWALSTHGSYPRPRVIVFRKATDGWRIVAEADTDHLKCAPDLLQGVPAPTQALITSTTRQAALLTAVLDKTDTLSPSDWDRIYCPPGFAPFYDSAIHEDDALDYASACRRDGEEDGDRPDAADTFMEVSGSQSGDHQRVTFTLQRRGQQVWHLDVSTP